jgi:ABC-2 type transport system ATP-binding protein
MISIEAENVVVLRGTNEVLHAISCVVKPGALTGLIGPSGSGKTTLMRAIVGVQKIKSGQLTVLGKPAGDALLRKTIGYVTQAPSVYGDLTVEQNLRYFGAIIGAPKSDVKRVMKEVQLEPQRTQIVDSLSGGQRARVSLAVALLGDPKLLVLDEPTVGLDPLLRDELWELFGKLAHMGKTLLVSSHVMDEAERCEELILMRDGAIVWNDTKEQLLSMTHKISVEAAFIQAIKGEV